MPSKETNLATRLEWRELGFFYDRDDERKFWRIVGSAEGLRIFSKLIASYAADPRNELLSEHDHFGPYAYLEIGTWNESQITDHWIAGSVVSLSSLAQTIAFAIDSLPIGKQVSLRSLFAANSPYDLILERRGDEFDPAEADAACWADNE